MADLNEAFAPLGDDELNGAKGPDPDPDKDAWAPITPIPDSAFPLVARLGGKEPRQTWIFRDPEGRALGIECRWILAEGKETRFATWCRRADGRESWRLRHLLPLRPIYGLDRLARQPLAPVLIVEGAKKCEPAVRHFPDHVAIAWPAGAGSVHLVNWSPLAGRKTVLWPDNDDAGRQCAAKLAGLVLDAGADSALVVPVPSDNFPLGWDLADRVPDGADLAALLAAARPAKAPEPTWPVGFRMLDRGLVWHDLSDDEKPEVVVSGKFDLLAETRDDAGWSWGLLLRWQDPDGRPREWAMPRAMLAGDGADVRRALLDGGLSVSASIRARSLLSQFLTSVHVEHRAKAVPAVGWYGTSYVLPDGAIGRTNGERAILQTPAPLEHAYNVRGELREWKDNVARYAAGNSRLALAVSTAFAAALVGPCGIESGGVHFRGPSSIGKTTALAMAGSVWGGGERTRYVRNWRATANGLEMVATAHNDTLLCLDELSQVSAREAGQIAYMLSNGQGKSRASRDATMRRTARWRLLFLSSGEIGLADKLAEDARGRRPTAGQQVRVVDVPADTGVHGLFEHLHGFADPGAFARHLVAASLQFYGTAARAFIGEVAADLDSMRRAVAEGVASFIAEHCPAGADGQVERVAGRFGLIAVAGAAATDVGILPWPANESVTAAKACFAAWLDARGGAEPAEVRDGIAAVRAFVSANSTARFLTAWDDDRANETRITNLAGYRRQVTDGDGSAWDFYVTTAAWAEVCAGFDPKALAGNLASRGLLLTDKGPHRAKLLRIPNHGRQRVYHLPARLLRGDDGGSDA